MVTALTAAVRAVVGRREEGKIYKEECANQKDGELEGVPGICYKNRGALSRPERPWRVCDRCSLYADVIRLFLPFVIEDDDENEEGNCNWRRRRRRRCTLALSLSLSGPNLVERHQS